MARGILRVIASSFYRTNTRELQIKDLTYGYSGQVSAVLVPKLIGKAVKAIGQICPR